MNLELEEKKVIKGIQERLDLKVLWGLLGQMVHRE